MLEPVDWCTLPTNPLPFGIALAAFFFADGVIGYRLLHQGQLNDLRVLNKTYLALSVIAVLVLAGFLLYWPEGGYQPSSARSPGGG